MKLRVLALMAAAVLVVGLLAVPGLATYTNTDSGDTSSSEAEISVVDCVVESTKDISYIAFLSDGSQVDKIEGVDAESYNLDNYAGIDDVDQVRVKAGTTVATFAVNCGDATTDGDDTHDEAKDDDTDTDDHATEDEHDDDSTDDDATWDDHDDDDVKEEDSDDDSTDEDSDDDSDDDAETDGEWDARHDGRHDQQDHEEIDHEDS